MKTAIVVIISILLACVVLYLLLIMPRMYKRPDKKPFFEGILYAHRGLHDNASEAPENSMAAFEKAIEAGYGIELDVQLTKDKIPVIFHDFTLQRVCGVEGKVAEYTYEELQQFSLCGSEQKIPKLADFLKLADGRVPLIIEYKLPAMQAEVCAVADKLLAEYKGVYCIESFNPLALLWYRRNRKEIMRGQLAMNFLKSDEKEYPPLLYFALGHLLFNFLTKPDFIAYNHGDYKGLSRRLCRYLYRCTAVAWTIRNEAELGERKQDFDLFIFDSFVPAEK
ncbi:MAG: glycerophosphodiester phosphodiesterase [Lachnospiraceae bacterium]|nr:glycerophosphodiester phosphodiesterase [Lachnospiraceae bacterium]MBQ9136946.1 glycerophosphodiester phosphodiesterase [Lachnospiraceae bacterium]